VLESVQHFALLSCRAIGAVSNHGTRQHSNRKLRPREASSRARLKWRLAASQAVLEAPRPPPPIKFVSLTSRLRSSVTSGSAAAPLRRSRDSWRAGVCGGGGGGRGVGGRSGQDECGTCAYVMGWDSSATHLGAVRRRRGRGERPATPHSANRDGARSCTEAAPLLAFVAPGSCTPRSTAPHVLLCCQAPALLIAPSTHHKTQRAPRSIHEGPRPSGPAKRPKPPLVSWRCASGRT
jgi:hypothetical protein